MKLRLTLEPPRGLVKTPPEVLLSEGMGWGLRFALKFPDGALLLALRPPFENCFRRKICGAGAVVKFSLLLLFVFFCCLSLNEGIVLFINEGDFAMN